MAHEQRHVGPGNHGSERRGSGTEEDAELTDPLNFNSQVLPSLRPLALHILRPPLPCLSAPRLPLLGLFLGPISQFLIPFTSASCHVIMAK